MIFTKNWIKKLDQTSCWRIKVLKSCKIVKNSKTLTFWWRSYNVFQPKSFSVYCKISTHLRVKILLLKFLVIFYYYYSLTLKHNIVANKIRRIYLYSVEFRFFMRLYFCFDNVRYQDLFFNKRRVYKVQNFLLFKTLNFRFAASNPQVIIVEKSSSFHCV